MVQILFVGRERERECYQELLREESPWVLVITGQPGNGKSALLRQLSKQTPHDTPAARLDFSIDRLCIDPLAVLEQLAGQLKPHCTEQTGRAFEQALHQGRSELATTKQMQSIVAREHAIVTGNQLTMSAREQRQQVQESVRAAFFAMMDTLRAARLVLMLDTCERLQEAESFRLGEVGAWVMNDLLPGLYTLLQQKRCHFRAVIASRIYPQLEAIDEQERRHLKLPMLEQPAVEQYLQFVGMHDQALRQRVYNLTHGHALCIFIIGTLWQERGEQDLTLADLPMLHEQFTERALLKFVGERILDKRLKSPFRELTRYGILLRSFNLPLLQAIFPELHLELDQFRQLILYPYVERPGNQRYAFHDLLREIQAEELREQEPEKWRHYHKRALDYLTQTAPHSPDWYYHVLAYEEEQGISKWWNAIQEAQLYGEREYVGELLKVAHDGALSLSSAACAWRAYWQGRFYYYGGDMPAALQSYEEALTLFRQVGDRLGEANVLQAMGDVQQFRDEREAALQSYEEALTLFRQVGDRLGEANVLQAMGDVQQFRDEREAALQSYEEALTLFRQVGDRLGEANVRKAMGDVQQFRDEREAALQSYEEALTLFRQVGDRLGEANVRKAMGDVQQFRKDMPAALQSYEEALTLFRQVGDRLGEANVLQAMGDVQQFRDEREAALQSYEEALTLFRQVGSKLGEANVLQAMGDVQQFRDEREAALQSYEEALTLFRQVGSKLGEANVLQAMGDVQQFRDEREAALQSYEEALTLFRQVGSKLGEANCYLAQGRIALEQRDYQKALTLHTDAYQLYQQIQDGYSQTRLLYYRSFVYEVMSERHLAVQDIVTAMAIAELLSLPFIDLLRQRLNALEQVEGAREQEASISQIVSLLDEFARADWSGRYKLLTEHADVLLSEHVEPVFDALLKENTDPEVTDFLEHVRALLRRCRAWNIDPVWYFELHMRLGDSIDIPPEHEPDVMHIATLLSQHEDYTAWEQALEAMQQLAGKLTTTTPGLFRGALLRDLAETMEQLPTNHPRRQLDQIAAYYQEALPLVNAIIRVAHPHIK